MFLEYPSPLKGSGGPQKPFSWLSDGARGVFTINTEAGEQTLFPHPHPRCPLMCWWSVVRVNIV